MKKYFLLLGLFFLPLSTSFSAAVIKNECHGVTDTNTAIPDAFGAPWNVFKNILFMTAECDENDIRIEIGNEEDTQYIWNQAYYTNDGKTWKNPITLTGDKTTTDGKWIMGTATGNISVADAEEKNYFAAYMCEWKNDEWKCGCRDIDTCSSTGFWSIQTFQEIENIPDPVDTEDGTDDNTDDTNQEGENINQGEVACMPQTQEGRITYYERDKTEPVSCSYDIDKIPVFHGALNAEQYADGAACGACARVTGPKGTVDIEIVNLCPDDICVKGHIDLSKEAFEQVSDSQLGIAAVEWEYIPCAKNGDVSFFFKEGSSQYWAAVQVRNAVHPIQSVAFKNTNGAYEMLTRTNYGYFIAEKGMGEGPYSFRITDIYGQIIDATNIPLQGETELNGGNNFPACIPQSE